VSDGEGRAVLVHDSGLPGLAMGRGYIRDGGKALFFTVRPVDRSVAIRTASCTYLLAPRDRAGFIATLEGRRLQANAAEGAEPGPGLLETLGQPFAIILLALAALAEFALYGFIAWWYPALPSALPIHFTVAGLPDAWGPPASVLLLPKLGALALLADVAIAALPPLRRPMTTFVLLSTALLVQVFAWVAFLRLLPSSTTSDLPKPG